MEKIIILSLITLSSFAQNIVKTSNGRVQGYVNGEVQIFKGVPFAAPPMGELRWKSPQPVQNWSDIKKCTEFSASPIQNKPAPFYCWSEEFIAKPEPLSEDCLYLNVWTTAKSNAKKQPVFVWIYGGGLNSGSANCDIYDGEEMAKKGVVFVSLNYRVGVFGFMAHPELSKESGNNSSGNYGFLDQMAALRWIQENIEAFGGDPQNVTIAGQSAGAFSVNALIASPLAKGLFHKAVLQSGGLLSNMLSQDLINAEAQGLVFMKKAKANSLADLRQRTAQELQILSNNQEIGRFGTTLDGYILPTNLIQHFKDEKHNQVPMLAGWVTGDGSFLGESKMTLEDYNKEAQNKYEEKATEYLNIFPATNNDEVKAMKQRQTLIGFAALPIHLLATLTHKSSYLYQFSHVPPNKANFPDYGVFHTSEVPFALHNLHTWQRPWQLLDKEIENVMSSYWINFAKTGNPMKKVCPSGKITIKPMGTLWF
jgi:para-nitrobenzyl esterase